MAKVQIGSNANFLGGGLQLSLIGKHAYAYSGLVNVSTTETDLLNFTTAAKGYIIGKFQVTPAENHDEDVVFKWYLNGIQVQSLHIFDNKVAGSPMSLHNYILLVIPPGTTVRVTGDMSANAFDQVCTFTGTVYDA